MKDNFVIFPDDGAWRLGSYSGDNPGLSIIETDDGDEAESCLDAVYEAMIGLGYVGGPVLLAVPSHWCAAAPISTDSLPRKDRQAAMAYRLEEKLPIAAEQFTAGFILGGAEALGICVMLEKVRPVIKDLESRGIDIHSVIPAAMLATQFHMNHESSLTADLLIWQNSDGYDIFTFDPAHRLPTTWSSLPNDPDELKLLLNMLAIHGRHDINMIVAGEQTNEIKDSLRSSSIVHEIETHARGMHLSAMKGAEQVINDRLQPWVDLNGVELGATGRSQKIIKPLKAALVATVLMLICLNAAMLWRANEYHKMADHDTNQQRSLFIKLFPDQKPPLTIDKRLASEYKKLSGMRGKSQALPKPPVTLTLMHHVLNRLPSTVRFRLTEIRIEDDSLYLDGQARSHGDVGSIANALGVGDDTLKVETRHTEQLANRPGVSFVIVASPVSTQNQVTMR